MTIIVLETLQCITKHDLIGPDECRLEFTVDQAFQPPLHQQMTGGQYWALNREIPFQSFVLVKLWDEESLVQDYLIGEVRIGNTAANHSMVSIAGQNAKYQLQYSVVADGAPVVDEVQDAIHRFEVSVQPGVWPYIGKEDLIADIRATTANPYQVNQGTTPLCGPASIVFQLAARYPRRYVEICQSLYETGQFQCRTHTVQPSATLRASRVRSDVTLADWMLMATLRDTENFIFPVQNNSSVFVMGFTKPWEMQGWTFELLNFDHNDFNPLVFFGKCEAIQKAQDVVKNGGSAFMMIQSAMLGNKRPLIPYPDHWITFMGNLSIDDTVWRHQGGHIRFDCYSWGQLFHLDLEEKSFEDYTWGIVYGS